MATTTSSLADVLCLVGWNARDLVRAINASLSSHGRQHLRIDPTAAYPWIQRGYLPRPPIPAVAAAVLSRELGRIVTIDHLWPGRTGSPGPDSVG